MIDGPFMGKKSKQLNQMFLQSAGCVNDATDIIYPSYKRDEVNIGIVHLGLGAFHRSHQAMYTEQLLNLQGGGDWGICAVSFRNEALQTQLDSQDCLYTMAILDVQDSFQVVGAIKEASGTSHGLAADLSDEIAVNKLYQELFR